MNEEEKQAIEKFGNLLTKHFENKKIDTVDYLDYFEGITILNLIDKQQKEIEELNKENTRQQELIGNIHQKWKDKIKEKMRGEINKSWRNTEQRKCQLYAYDILKELLGETND